MKYLSVLPLLSKYAITTHSTADDGDGADGVKRQRVKVPDGLTTAERLYQSVRHSSLYDTQLGMYKVFCYIYV